MQPLTLVQSTKVRVHFKYSPDFDTPTTSAFINKSIDSLTDAQRKAKWDGWVANFKKACGTEKAFLDLGSDPTKFPAYNVVATDVKTIVKDGTYTIRSYRKDTGYLTPGVSDSVTIKALSSDGKVSECSFIYIRNNPHLTGSGC